MGKYIVELKDRETLYKAAIKNGDPYVTIALGKPYTAPDLEQVRKEAYEKGQKDLRESCVPQDEEAYGFGYHEGFQQGLGSAWEAAKKIWEYDLTTLREIFGEGIMRMDFFMRFTASEVIEEIRAYEQAQKEKEEQIKIGDEVIIRNKTAVVTEITDRYVRIMYSDGNSYALFSKGMVKTGRHFPEIAEILAKMKETDNG